jgi:hypothetical protein
VPTETVSLGLYTKIRLKLEIPLKSETTVLKAERIDACSGFSGEIDAALFPLFSQLCDVTVDVNEQRIGAALHSSRSGYSRQ